jgi:hypothetical protein
MDTFNFTNTKNKKNLSEINSNFFGITLAIESIDNKFILAGKINLKI